MKGDECGDTVETFDATYRERVCKCRLNIVCIGAHLVCVHKYPWNTVHTHKHGFMYGVPFQLDGYPRLLFTLAFASGRFECANCVSWFITFAGFSPFAGTEAKTHTLGDERRQARITDAGWNEFKEDNVCGPSHITHTHLVAGIFQDNEHPVAYPGFCNWVGYTNCMKCY